MNYRSKVYERYVSVSGLNKPLHSKYLALAHNLVPHLRTLGAGTRVLDIGSGQGECLLLYRNLGLDAEGVDVSEELVNACSERGLRVRLITNLSDFIKAGVNEWSVVSMIDVLEHFNKAEAAEIVRLIRTRVLKPGGRIILQVPNMQSPFATLNLYHDLTHEWGYTEKSIRQLLDAVGFKKVEVYPQNYPRQGLYLLRHFLRQLLYAVVRGILVIDQPNRGRILTPNLVVVAEE